MVARSGPDIVLPELAAAKVEEHFQAVGLLCREALISLGQAVFLAERHPTVDGVKASSTDAKRMLEAYFVVELGGGDQHVLNDCVFFVQVADFLGLSQF